MATLKNAMGRFPALGTWALSIGFVVLLVILTAFQLRAGYTRTLRVAEANLADTARVTEEQVRGSLRVVRLILKSMAEAPRGDAVALRAFMAAQIGVIPEIRQAAFIDTAGQIRISTLPQLEGRDISRRPYFLATRDLPPDLDLHVTKPLPLGGDGSDIVLATMPLRDARGRFAGMISVSLDLGYFLRLLKSVHSGEDGAGALLVTPEGDIIGRDPEPELYVGKNIAKGGAFALHRQSGQAISMHVHVTVTDGKPKVSAVRTLTEPSLPPLVVIVGRPLDGVLAPWWAEASIQALVVTALALAVFALTALLQRHMVALGHSEERYRGLIETQNDFIVRIGGGDGRLVFANDAFAAAVGRRAGEVVGQPWQSFIHPDDVGITAAAIAEVARPPAYRADVESRMASATGLRWVAWEGAGIHGKAGEVAEIQAVGRDITQWVEYRERQKTLLRDLDNSNRELEQFAYVASHDLREPLRMISSYMALLDRRYQGVLDGDGREFLEFAREGARRMDRMVLDLLEFSRVGRVGDPFAPVALAEVVETAIANLKLTIDETAAAIRIDGDLPVVMGAHGELVRLFQNLVGNALKYRHAGRAPAITIGVRPAAGEWAFTIADNGIGIAAEYFERIFDIFQRLHTRNEYDGTGIGLAVCRKIVEHHGGRIWVESVPGEGTVFHFTLAEAERA